MAGKGTSLKDIIVVKAPGGKTLTMVYIQYGTVTSYAYAYGEILRLRFTVYTALRSYDRMLLKSYGSGRPY